MEPFLSRLKRKRPSYTTSGTYTHPDLYFQLNIQKDEACLDTVNAQGESVEADYHYYPGNTAQLLRNIERIRREQTDNIRWETLAGHQQISLREHPYLLYQLMACPNVVNAKMKPLQFSGESASLQLLLRREGENIVPTLQAKTDGKEIKRFQILTDSFLLTGSTLHQMLPLGEGYDQLPFLIEPFSADLLENYLSIFFSYIENVQPVSTDDYEISVGRETADTVPAILFEKVTRNQSLYLKVIPTVPGLPSRLLQEFDLTHVAMLSQDRQVRLKRIVRHPIEEDVEQLRKLILQHAPNRQAQKEVFQNGDFFIIPPETAGPFLLHSLPTLLSRYQLVGIEKLSKYHIRIERPRLHLQFSSGIDFLEGTAEVELGEERMSLQQLLSQYRKQRYVQLPDGDRVLVESRYMRRIERLFQTKSERVKVSFFDLPEVEDLLNERIEGEAAHLQRDFYEGFNRLEKEKLQLPGLKATLRPYQKEGVKWIRYLYRHRMGGCLADDMGLGKTVQAIAMLTLIYPQEQTPTLVVMPRSLIFNWQNELARFAPQLSVYTYYGSDRDLEEARKRNVILTTYALLRNHIREFSEQEFHYIILDESQNAKNLSTQITQSVLLLKGAHRLALSGTPMENNLTELYALFRFLNPPMFGSLNDFNTRYTYPIQKENDPDALQSLRRKIFPFMLRRLKKDVLKELPDRMEHTLYAEMEPAQARFYEERRRYYFQQIKENIRREGIQRSQLMMFQAMNELRRIASVPESLSNGEIKSAKLEILMETVAEAVANRHKVVVFYNFIAGIELTGERLEEMGIDYACMTGSTTDRRSVVERFQHDPDCMVLLMTLKTGGVGLNLTAADTVLLFEPWWNKAAEEQAVNRLHRYGQQAKVMSYSLITRGTIEEKILLLQQQKAALFADLISSDSSLSKRLSEEDMEYIFK